MDQEVYEEEDDLEFLEDIKDRVKDNIDSYYEDKSLIKDEEVLMILDTAYNWLYDLLTDDLKNLKTFNPRYRDCYVVIYGTSKDNLLLAYNNKFGSNDIDFDNFYLKFKSYMGDYITDYKTLIIIIHRYLVNTLQMKGSHTSIFRKWNGFCL